MMALRRRRVRWPIEAAVIVGVTIALLNYNAARDCRSALFDLPATCDTGWVGTILLVMVAAAGVGELIVTLRRRPCPRCGRGVVRGRLDCPHCEFDFRMIGA